MKIHTHGNGNGLNDLYVFPQGELASRYIDSVARFHGMRAEVSATERDGKRLVEIPFGESLAGHFACIQESELQEWKIQFTGRKLGAIGISYKQTATVVARNPEEARDFLSNDFEHVEKVTWVQS